MDENIKSLIRELKTATLIASKDILTLREAAIYLGISEQALRAHLPEIRRYQPCRNIYLRKRDLDDWVLSNPIPSDADIERQAAIYCDNH